MKRIFTLMLCLLLLISAFAIVSCNKDDDDDDKEDKEEEEDEEDDLFVDLDIGANCESSVSLTALLVVGIIGGAVVFKKKED